MHTDAIARSLSEITRAKINLSLNITGKRADGYHTLHSLVAFCDVGDVVSVAPADILNVHITGEYGGILHTTDNLILQAARLLQQYSGTTQGASITLEKNLPVASGIGGGSGDAATTLSLLNKYWQCHLPLSTLQQLGLQLGADIPVCLHNQACIMSGIGEKITALTSFPTLYAVLVNPLKTIATRTVFSALKASAFQPAPEISTPLSIENIASLTNDLQPIASQYCPDIATILQSFSNTEHLVCARMSGSGATCFGLYRTQEQAKAAQKQLDIVLPNHWIRSGTLS